MNMIIENRETAESDDIILKVREAQIRQLYKQTGAGMTGTIIVALFVGIVLWPVIPHWKLLLWTGVMVLITFGRILFSAAFYHKSPSGKSVFRWARLHAAGTAASALMWGLPSFFLWPVNSPVHQMVLPICIVSISATAVALYCTWKPSYLLFLILSTIPISLRLLLEGGIVYILLGLLGFIFIGILAYTGKLMHDASMNALMTGIHNEALNSFLSEEKVKEEELNTQLQKEITERTYSQEELRLQNQELERLNAQLIITKNRLESANRELESALLEVKQLSGMLPICSSCKKIRNDEGYWEQIEGYIRDHSEVEFSHSICPECVEKLYPDYYRKS
jgi:hypothetical protein